MITNWNGKPYHSLDYMLKERFGEKVYKVTLNGGMSCPNRDGTIGHGGCIFCSEGGSGDFAASAALSIAEQIDSQIAMLSAKRPIHKYIAYFQAYTNTYAPVPYLEKIFQEAISHPGIVALSIGTRPDCLGDDVVELLSRLNRIKPWSWDFRPSMNLLPLTSEGDIPCPVSKIPLKDFARQVWKWWFTRSWVFQGKPGRTCWQPWII